MSNYSTKYHLVTYLNKDEIDNILSSHAEHIIAGAYILHDKDIDTVPHIHLLLYLDCSRKSEQILNWFKIDERNTLINNNTFSRPSSIAYLTHTDPTSIAIGKYPYNNTDITFFNCDIKFFLSDRKQDLTYSMLEDVLNGLPLRQLAMNYGRDFIFHFKAIKELAEYIRTEEYSTSSQLHGGGDQ